MIAIQTFVEWLASCIEIILYLFVIHSMAENKFPKTKQAVLFFSISAAIATGVLLLNFIEISISLPTLLYSVIAFSLGACILYRGKFVEFLFAAIGFVAFLTFTDMLCVSVMSWFGLERTITEILSGFNAQRALFILLVKIIEIIFVFALFRKPPVPSRMSKGYATTVMCFVLGSVGSVYWITQAQSLISFELNPLQTLLCSICILTIYMIYLLLRMKEIQREREYTAQQNQILERNYQTAKQSYESNAKLYHDMWNHFLLVQGYLADGKISEAQEYLQKLSGDKITYSIEQWTGIEAVDYILSQKIGVARQHGIEVDIHAEYPKDCKIDPVDLCTILTNLLDNAIDACAKQPNVAEKKIAVTIRRIHQFIIIRIANSSTVAPIARSGGFVTSKQDSQQHGWGIRSVKSAVEKYQGTIKFDYSDSLFTVNAIIFYQ